MAQIENLRTGAKFKKTEAGEVPVEWSVLTLKDILTLNYGDGLPEEKRKSGIYPVYGSNGIIGYHDTALVNGPGIIVGRKGTIGNVEWSEKDFWPIDTTYYVSTDNEKVGLRWLYYQLQILKLNKFNTATGIPGLNREVALNLSVPYPPISEQKKIAEILLTVDSAIDKTSQLIEKKKELKKGLMQDLLSRGIGHKKFHKTEVGEIPEGWKVAKIKDVGEIITGGTPPTKNMEYYNGEYLWATPADLGMNKYIRSTKKMLSREGMEVSRIFPKDAILVVCIGSTIGKIGMAVQDMAANQQINSVICNNQWDSQFVYYWLFKSSNSLVSMAGRQAVPIVNKTDFSLLTIAKPPQIEQQRIGIILSIVDAEIEQEVNEKEKWEQMKKGLMQVLLTGKVRVWAHPCVCPNNYNPGHR